MWRGSSRAADLSRLALSVMWYVPTVFCCRWALWLDLSEIYYMDCGEGPVGMIERVGPRQSTVRG
jgi:hypothetical protein